MTLFRKWDDGEVLARESTVLPHSPPSRRVPCVSPVLVSCIRPTIQGVLCVPLNSSVSCPTLNSGVFSTLPISSIVLCPIPLSRLRAESLVRASSVLKFEPDFSWPQLFKHPLQVVSRNIFFSFKQKSFNLLKN